MAKTKIQMQRKGHRLEIMSPVWADLLEAFPEGCDLNVAITRGRSLPQLGTYWGCLDFVLHHGPEWMNDRWLDKDELSDALQLEVGFIRQVKLANGIVFAIPASKSFSECSQAKFNAYFEATQRKLAEWCEFDVVAAYLDHMAHRSGRKAA